MGCRGFSRASLRVLVLFGLLFDASSRQLPNPKAKYFVLDPPVDILASLDVGFQLECREFGHMYSFEIYFPDFVRDNVQSLAASAEEADFVVLPHCTTYLYHLYRYRYGYGETVEDCWEALRLVQVRYLLPLIAWAKQQPAHAVHGGKNFLIVYSMDKGRVDYPMASEATADWRALTTVGNGTAWLNSWQPYVSGREDSGPPNPCAGSVEKLRRFIWYPQDVVLPVPTAFEWTPRSSKRSLADRPRLLFFAGTPNSCLRRFICETFSNSSISDISISGEAMPRSEFQEEMYRSRFCLVPDGFSAISARFYEVMAHGCVPVIISEAFHPPFEGIVDVVRFALFIRPSEVPHVHHILRERGDRLHADLHEHLEAVAPFFNMELPTFWAATLHAIERR